MSSSLPVAAPLDPDFLPASLFNRNYLAAAKKSGRTEPLVIALERENGFVSRFETVVRADDHGPETLRYVERTVKFLLWAWGGWKIHLAAPPTIVEQIGRIYSESGPRKFDCDLMRGVYEKELQVVAATPDKISAAKEMQLSAGGHLGGCRIGFDLGASDYKVAALNNGEVVYSAEFPWNPKVQSDPGYHYQHLDHALRQAAAHLPRVDAIGGSSAGIIVDNEIRVASLLRAIPASDYPKAAKLFKRIQQEWNVPLLVLNDGDVTALAGALSLGKPGMLGIAMGSSLAAGFMDKQGRISGWLNELAFAPVDYNPNAPADEWSGDRGVGALYFSQQAVHRLLPATGIALPENLGQPETLKAVQDLMARGDERAAKIYQTVGVYLGYALAHYTEFYDFSDILILGRVTTGDGGNILLETARTVLRSEFPEIAARIALHVPDEKSRRVGQAVAAASLPPLFGTKREFAGLQEEE